MKSRALSLALLMAGLPGSRFGQLPSQPAAGQSETVVLDRAAAARPFPHFWEQIFGSGRANLTMRESWREDLRAVREHTGFRYVRFHAILDDENGVYDEDAQGQPVYNFSYVDEIYDGLLANRVRPFVEISFMPRKLAAHLTAHPFWYKPLPSPPNSDAKWTALMEAFTRHLIERYGKDEVEQWYFEVWNEPNIDFWNGEPKQATYFAFYDVTARALKSVDAGLRVGGPATAQAAWVDAFLAHCLKNRVPFDFVSTHVYGNEDSRNVFGKELPIKRKDMVGLSAKKVYDQVRQSGAPETPIIWSEYNATYMTQPEVTDSAFMGPWLANNIRECDGLQNMMSYWDLSDVFEEQGVVKTPFYGGYGLIAARHLPKASFWVFDMLHGLGEQRIVGSPEDSLLTRRANGTFVLAVWNYAEPGESAPAKTFRIEAHGWEPKSYRMRYVAAGHGSVLEAWRKMGAPALPTETQLQELRAEGELPPAKTFAIGEPVVLTPQTLAVIEVP